MEVGKTSLSGLLNLERVLMIPLFQRRYVWGREEWQQLWDDVTPLVEEGDNFSPYFMGPVVFASDNRGIEHITVFQVIDGQQRLMTFSILLCALRDVALEVGDEVDGEKMAKRILKYLINSDEDLPPGRYKVHPRYWDSDAFFDLVDRKKIDQRLKIAKAHRFFVDFIKQEGKTDKGTVEFCRQLLNILRSDKLQFASISLEATENPYAIFRSLNFSGVDLRAGDLIRNHVFMALPDKQQQQEFDENHWKPLESNFQGKGKIKDEEFERFFRASLMKEGKYCRKSDTYIAFEKAHSQKDIEQNPSALTDHYRHLAGYWRSIEDGEGLESTSVQNAVNRVGELSIGVAYPLVMRLLEMHEKGKISNSDVAESFRLISGFFLRRHICGKNSRGYDKWFCEVCGILGENPLANLRNFLTNQKGGWPDDSDFKAAFVGFDLYESRYRSAVLIWMERELQKANRPPEPIEVEKCWVEHVLPRALSDDWKKSLGDEWERIYDQWLHTPGNLTLIGSDYNREMSNHSFSWKKPNLSESNIRLNSDFASVGDNWGESEIKARGKKLAELAAKIWCGADED